VVLVAGKKYSESDFSNIVNLCRYSYSFSVNFDVILIKLEWLLKLQL